MPDNIAVIFEEVAEFQVVVFPSVKAPIVAELFQGLPGLNANVTHPKWEHITLSDHDIENQYVDLQHEIEPESLHASLEGIFLYEGSGHDYALSMVNGKTRFTFINDIASGGAKELIRSDILHFNYRY